MQCAQALRAVESLRRLRRRAQGAFAWLADPSIQGFAVATRDTESVVEIFVSPSGSNPGIPQRLQLPNVKAFVDAVVVSATAVRPLAAAAGSLVSDVSRADEGWSGSLGCRVRWRQHAGVYVLSNAHVFAFTGINEPAVRDPIIQPSHARGGRAPVNTIAQLSDWSRFTSGPDFPNVADAAIARLTGDDAPSALADLPEPIGINPHIVTGMSVHFRGAGSGSVRTGSVSKIGVCRELYYPQPGRPSAPFGFCGLVECTTGAKDGDSGSLVMDAENRAVGLLFAGSASVGLFTPIKTVFDLLDLELDLPGGGSVAPMPALPAGPRLGFTPQVQHVFSAIDILARTLWGEARGESEAGIVAVAAVVANRTRAQHAHWGLTVEAVCKADRQFSCWNEPQSDADRRNRLSLLNVGPENPIFSRCLEIARRTVRGDIDDPTGGANHYFNPAGGTPGWAAGVSNVVTIGRHKFLRL
jgi:N-acetylmuramoyl-L-alanine amidase